MPHKVETRHGIAIDTEPLKKPMESLKAWFPMSRADWGWMPINPARTESGAWVSLAKIVGEDKAHPIPLEPNASLSSFTLMAQEVEISLAAKLALGPIFSGTLNYNDRAFYLDATSFTDRYAEVPGNFVSGTRWGVGLRVLLRVYNIKGGFNLSIGVVGAAADLGFAKASYEIDGIGIEGGLQVVLGELNSFGELTAETYFKITNMVLLKLGEYMQKNPTMLKPEPYQVQLIEAINIDPILAAKPIVFAMHCLQDDCTLNEALKKAGSKYDQNEVKAVYAKMVPNLPPDQHPPESARDAAGNWLECT